MTLENHPMQHPTSLIVRLGGWLAKLENLLNGLGAASITLLMLLTVCQVLGRKLFNYLLFGYIDWTEQIMVMFAFSGVAYCQRVGGHIRMEVIIGHFRGRLLWFSEVIGSVVGLFIIGVMIPKSFDHFLRAWQLGDSSMNASLPIWPAKLIIPIAFTVLWARLLLQFFEYLRLLIHPHLKPLGVPTIMNIREEAAQQIQDTFDTSTMRTLRK